MVLYEFDGYVFTDNFDPEFPGYRKKGHSKEYVPVHNYVYWQHTGLIPKKGKTLIHHIDENKKNNSFENLEMISHKEHIKIHKPINGKCDFKTRSKISKNSKAGFFNFKGVKFDRRVKGGNKSFRTQIVYNNKTFSLGCFHDPLTCEILYSLIQNEIYGSMAEW